MTLPERTRIRLSKLISGILRHFPEKFDLALDEEGFVEIQELVRKIREKRKDLSWITVKDVLEVVRKDEKGRFEVKEGKIRARYGHSVEIKTKYPEDSSSKILYHGTSERSLEGIFREGIKPMKRKYVHLSVNLSDAVEVGRRHGGRTVILVIDAECLRKKGHKVFYASEKVRLTNLVPPDCILRVEYVRTGNKGSHPEGLRRDLGGSHFRLRGNS